MVRSRKSLLVTVQSSDFISILSGFLESFYCGLMLVFDILLFMLILGRDGIGTVSTASQETVNDIKRGFMTDNVCVWVDCWSLLLKKT